MLRFGLLGGVRPTAPWQVFVSLGGGALAAGALFTVLFPFWGEYAIVGLAEFGALAITGVVLVAVGLRRRRRALTGDDARPPLRVAGSRPSDPARR